jgi:hypothetical protein
VTRTSWRVLCSAVVVVVSVAACGRGEDAMTDATSGRLQARVAEIRDLASARRPDAVASRLDALRSLVHQLARDGEITDGEARRILASADAVTAQLGRITTTTTTTTSPPTTSPPTRPEKGHEKDRGHDKDGKGEEDD